MCLSVSARLEGSLGRHVSGIVLSFCLSISGLEGLWGSSFSGIVWPLCLTISSLVGLCGYSSRLLSGLSVCHFRASRELRGCSMLQLSGTPWFLCLSIAGLEGLWGSRCQELPGLSIFECRASRDSDVPVVGYCLVILFVVLVPRGTLGFQLSVCRFWTSKDSGARAVRCCLAPLPVNSGP